MFFEHSKHLDLFFYVNIKGTFNFFSNITEMFLCSLNIPNIPVFKSKKKYYYYYYYFGYVNVKEI